MNQPIGSLDPRDPKYCLSHEARVRIDDAHFEGSALRAQVLAKLLARYNSKPNREDSFGEYCQTGQAAVTMHDALCKYARLVIMATARELWAYGRPINEIHTAMNEEIEGAINSLELNILDRDLLQLQLSQLLRRLNAEGPPEPQSVTRVDQANVATSERSHVEKPSRKSGPKPMTEQNRRVAELAARYEGDWRDRVSEICTLLDAELVAFPKSWRKNGCSGWVDGLDANRELVVKALEYRLKAAQK